MPNKPSSSSARVRRNRLRERATPREEMLAMQLGIQACETLATFGNGNWRARQAWKEKADRISDILRRTRNGYKYGP